MSKASPAGSKASPAGSNSVGRADDRATVVVVGAGPAGSAAAIELGRAGIDTVVIDKAEFPRDKCCGDGLTTAALRQLQALGLEPQRIRSWKRVDTAWLCTPAGHRLEFPLGGRRNGPAAVAGGAQYAATATRAELDAELVRLAGQLARMRTGVGLTDIEVAESTVTVTTDSGPIRADFVIAADGMWSPTRKALGLSPRGYRGEWHGLRQYFAHVGPAAASELFVWFEPDLVPGYLWSFPLADGRANVGFGILRSQQAVGDMARRWPELLARPHIAQVLGPDATAESSVRAWPIPARAGELTLGARRVLFAGDAAGACDPLTGEGIGQALQTGSAAARAIIDSGAASTGCGGAEAVTVAQHYEAQVAKHLVIDMNFAGRLSGVLAHPLRAEWALRTAGATEWTRANFARWLFEDYPRALISTPSRWSRALAESGGAW